MEIGSDVRRFAIKYGDGKVWEHERIDVRHYMNEPEEMDALGVVETRVFAIRSLAVMRVVLIRLGVMVMVCNIAHGLVSGFLQVETVLRKAHDIALNLKCNE